MEPPEPNQLAQLQCASANSNLAIGSFPDSPCSGSPFLSGSPFGSEDSEDVDFSMDRDFDMLTFPLQHTPHTSTDLSGNTFGINASHAISGSRTRAFASISNRSVVCYHHTCVLAMLIIFI